MNSANRIGNTSKNQIIISKNDIPRLKKDFGFFEAFIDRNFSNSDQYFDKDGNYILKKELFPEEMVHFNSNSGEEYIIKRNDMWKAIPNALNDYHVPNKILADFLANFLIFKTNKNSLFNPTVPEQETIAKRNNIFIAGPSKAELKRKRRTQREINKLRRNLGENFNNNNNNNDYVPLFYRPLTNQQLSNILTKEKRDKQISEAIKKLREERNENVETLAEKLQSIYSNRQKIAKALYLTERANANRTKYNSKPAKLPGTVRNTVKGKRKGKRETQKRKSKRMHKTQRQQYYNNEGYENEGNTNEENENYEF